MTTKANLTITQTDTHIIIEGRRNGKVDTKVIEKTDGYMTNVAETVLDFATPPTKGLT